MEDHAFMTRSLYLEILPKEQKELFHLFTTQDWLGSFYMVGDTALALQIGHRQSIDFDFFSKDDLNTKTIIFALTQLGSFELYDEADNTLNASVNNVKVSFFKFEYPLLKKTRSYQTLLLAGLLDIALMKLSVIAGRGAKKDFIDIYFLLRVFSLHELFSAFEKKFGAGISNYYHLQKSLVYFDDAENEDVE